MSGCGTDWRKLSFRLVILSKCWDWLWCLCFANSSSVVVTQGRVIISKNSYLALVGTQGRVIISKNSYLALVFSRQIQMFMENTTKLIFSQHNIFININISLCSLFSDFFSINANEVNKIKNVNNRSRLYTSLLYTHCRPFVMLFNIFSEIKGNRSFTA